MNNYAHRAAIVGVTGYAGQELDRILTTHPKFTIAGRFASKADEKSHAEAFSMERLRSFSPDVVVLATEHELSMKLVPELLRDGYRVVDMSGAFRLKESAQYVEWYGFEHTAPELLKEAAYGLPEFLSEQIRGARLVANPGCYATAAVLPLIPLHDANAIDPACTVVVDGKSGVSGAGRTPKPETHFCEVNENLSAYGVLNVPNTKVGLLGRVDVQKPDKDLSNNRQTRFIGGISYQINQNLRALADVDNLSLQSGVYPNAIQSTRTQGLFQIQFVF